jgi:hypothetical protein
MRHPPPLAPCVPSPATRTPVPSFLPPIPSPAQFLFALSGRMTAFHRDCNVLGADTAPAVRDARLRLCAATLAVMRQAMLLLGLEPLERF